VLWITWAQGLCSLDGGADHPTERGNIGVDMEWPIVGNGELICDIAVKMCDQAVFWGGEWGGAEEQC